MAELTVDVVYSNALYSVAEDIVDSDMRELAKRTVKKVNSLSDQEFAALSIDSADEI